MKNNYFLTWNEYDKNGQIITKKKGFDTQRARDKFAAKLQANGNFINLKS